MCVSKLVCFYVCLCLCVSVCVCVCLFVQITDHSFLVNSGSMNRFHITHFGGLMPPSSTSPNGSLRAEEVKVEDDFQSPPRCAERSEKLQSNSKSTQ